MIPLLARLKWLPSPPIFDGDADKSRVARLVHCVGLTWIAVTALHFLALRLLRPEPGPAPWLLALALLVPGLSLLILHRGHIGLASGTLVVGTWLAMVANTAASTGMPAAVFPGLVLVILTASIFLGWRVAAAMGGLTILIGFFLQYAQVTGLLPALATSRPWPELAADLVFTIAVAVVVKLSIDTITQSLSRARGELAARQQAEAGLQQRVAQLNVLHELAQAILYAKSVEAMAEAAVNQIRRLVPCSRAAVYLFDFAAGEAVPLAATPVAEPGATLARLPLEGFGLASFLPRNDPVCRVEDLLGATPSSAYEADLREAGMRSRLEAPLSIGAELAGSLSLIAQAPGAFSESHANLAGQVADLLAIGIRQAQLQEEIQRHSDELEQRVVERTAQLATANEDLAHEVAQRQQIQDELKATNTQLTTWVGELEAHTQEMALVNELVALLQACQTAAEANAVVGNRMPGLFPGSSGGLSIIQPSRQMLETATQWGATNDMLAAFAPGDCWALRRAQPHVVRDPASGLLCSHWSRTPPSCLCVPLLANGEVLGCLHLVAASGQLARHTQHLAKTVADAVALTLAGLSLRETLRLQSIIDPLTGLFNRRYLEETLQREVRRSKRSGSGLAVILADCDHFKNFNDGLGHGAGDQVLSELGRLLRAEIRAEDIACRYGGDEFVLILPDTHLAAAAQRAQQLLEAARGLRVEWDGQVIGAISLSLGVAAAPDHGLTGVDILRAADGALYSAKRQGRDRIVVAPLPAELAGSAAGV